MRRTVLAALTALAACGGPVPPWTQAPAVPIDLKLAVAPATVQLLQPVTVTLDLFVRDGVEVDFAPQAAPADFLATATTTPAQPLFGGRWTRTTLVLKPVRGPADIVLPPFVAKAKHGSESASTPEQTIAVTTALAGAGNAIEAPGEPFPAAFRGWWWLAAAAAALLALALMFVALARARGRRPQAEEVALPPHVKALRALQRLHDAPRTTPAEIDAFYVEVSRVLRVYLEERFALHAPERTTEEFLRELEGGDAFARDHRRELERFLSQCDLVKFAAFVPGEREHLATWELARAFVDATRGDRNPARLGAAAEEVTA